MPVCVLHKDDKSVACDSVCNAFKCDTLTKQVTESFESIGAYTLYIISLEINFLNRLQTNQIQSGNISQAIL